MSIESKIYVLFFVFRPPRGITIEVEQTANFGRWAKATGEE